MLCNGCGAKLDPNVKFCNQCGTRVPKVEPEPSSVVEEKICPSCGATVKASNNFCQKCGSPMIASSKPVPVVEEKICPSCGMTVDKENKFCPKCGSSLDVCSKLSVAPVVTSNSKVDDKQPENSAAQQTTQFGGGDAVTVSSIDGNLIDYIFSTKGRLNRQKYIIAIIAISIANVIVELIPVVGWILSLALTYSMLTFEVRRLHDMNKPAWPAYVAFGLGILALIGVVPSLILGAAFNSGFLASICGLILLGCFAFGIYLMCIKGTDGPNQYGPDPLAK